jgi:DNA invertase Pin-like site-specific DNA recombinase
MSTDLQDRSPTVQKETVARYAADHGLEVVKTYADEGISGLTLRERPGLQALLADISDGQTGFGVVLVYDVSRWGRFQDTDESAHYEYLCRRAGVRVEYCTEPFENDLSPMTSVMKSLKRVMAGEYSRELSAKVLRAKVSLAAKGFRPGGMAGYGYRRALVRADGSPTMVLGLGEHKFIKQDHVVLVAGPDDEVQTVRWIFEQVADLNRRPCDIARDLNERGVAGPEGRPWVGQRVQAILTNPKYTGELIYNRKTMRLKAPIRANPESEWVRVPGAHPTLVEPEVFARAQSVMSQWSSRVSNEAALAKLAKLYKRTGWLSTKLIEQAQDVPGPHFFVSRFGSLVRAYHKVGFEPERDYGFITNYARRRELARLFRNEVALDLAQRGIDVRWYGKQVLVVGGHLRVTVMLAMCRRTDAGPRWSVQINGGPPCEWILARRMTVDEIEVRDHWLYPAVMGTMYLGAKHRTIRERYEQATLDTVLEALIEIAGRQRTTGK